MLTARLTGLFASSPDTRYDNLSQQCKLSLRSLSGKCERPMIKDFQQSEWNDDVAEDCLQIVRLAIREDLGRQYDWTTVSLVGSDVVSRAAVVARTGGVIAGLPAAQLALAEMDPRVVWRPLVADGAQVAAGASVATLEGPGRTLLTAERLVLNLLGRLSGIATLASAYVAAVAGTAAKIYDTRKTTPGWRRLEKYAVHMGGARNHRTGLFDAILIKDNHLAVGAAARSVQPRPSRPRRRSSGRVSSSRK